VSDPPPNPETFAPSSGDDAHAAQPGPAAGTLATPLEQPAWPAGEDAGEEWVTQTKRGIRVGFPAAALLALVLLAGGFWAGAALQKSQGSGSSTLAGVAARLRSALGAGATGGAGSRFGGLFAGGGATVGTISTVDGDTLYVTTSTGSIVRVTLSKSTTITRNADASAVDLRPGDTVTVEGATGARGSLAATSVSATAPGVSSGFGGFARGLGLGATGTAGPNTSKTPALFGGG
jgi:hypothetical protein